MTTVRAGILGALAVLWAANAAAQTDRTRTDGAPFPAGRAPDTAEVGHAKPPGRDADPAPAGPIGPPPPRKAADDAVGARVCIGCGGEATGSVSPASGLPAAHGREGSGSNALASAPAPRQQPDLDTVALAAAHREKAQSMEERTTGLWRSWLVSVCEGCGDQRPARAVRLEDWPARAGPATTGATIPATPAERPAGAGHRASLLVDLSTGNIDTIRRRPPR